MKWLWTLVLCGLAPLSYAQHGHETEQVADSTVVEVHNVKEFLGKGHWEGGVRFFSMYTLNKASLDDYYAYAGGGQLHYHTARWKGFEFGVGGIFTFNLASSDLEAADTESGKASRYEIQLFDVQHPHNTNDLDRLEELYLRYYWTKSGFVEYGKISLETPLLNAQDTRMKPYRFGGLHAKIDHWKHWDLEAAWIHKVSPRAVVHWYSLGEAIGLYSQGFTRSGEKSKYAHHINTKGLGLIGATRYLGAHTKVQAWNFWLDQISNTAWLQADAKLPYQSITCEVGAQFVHQTPLHTQTNTINTYYETGQQTFLWGAHLGMRYKQWKLGLNYTQIEGTGRFTFPRELGREKLYTTLPRARVEGLGQAKVFVGHLEYHLPKCKGCFIDLAYGYYDLPPINDYAFNKYSTVSHHYGLIDFHYAFQKFLKGTEIRALYLYKPVAANANADLAALHNTADMHHASIIVNLTF